MIITSDSKKEEAQTLVDVSDPNAPRSSTSAEAPPPFEETESHPDNQALVNYDGIPGSDEPPPDFAPYEAEFFETGSGDIVSHDKHLNEDGTLQKAESRQIVRP